MANVTTKLSLSRLMIRVFSEVQELGDLNRHFQKEMAHFFETYKKVQNKEVSVGPWHGKEEAMVAFEKSREMYEADKK